MKGQKQMGKILNAIATDHLCVEPEICERNSKFHKARNQYCTLGEKLMAKLNEEEQKMLDDYSTAQAEESLLYGNDRFVKGFRLGVLMMMEVIADEDDLILHEGECL